MTCITCNNLKSHGTTGQRMARQGFGGCAKQPAWQFFSLSRKIECADYQTASVEKIERRKEWMGK